MTDDLSPELKLIVDQAVDRFAADEEAQMVSIREWLAARGKVAVDAPEHRLSTLTPLYLEPEECVVLLRALAKAVQSDDGILPNDATALSKLVWDSEFAAPIQRSLATALAEATYGPRSIAGPVSWLALEREEPLPEGLPDEVAAVLRESRTRAGFCDHGRRFGECCTGG